MSSVAEKITANFTELANSAAFSIARTAMVDAELREALSTVRLAKGAVRIGDYDIRVARHHLYDIHTKDVGKLIVAGLVYYDTARNIVAKLNSGVSPKSMEIIKLVIYNEEFARLQADIDMYNTQIDDYYERGLRDRALLIENRLSAAEGKADVLRCRLISRNSYI